MDILNASNIVLYGKGAFTTIAAWNGKPFALEKHLHRIAANAAKLDLDISAFSESLIEEKINREIAKTAFTDGRLRLTFSDERASSIWSNTSESQRTRLSILTAGFRKIPPNVKLTQSPYSINSRSPLAGIKSCNYLEQILSLDEAKGRGFHEAVRVNERGHVTSGCMSNIFWLKDDRLYTPTLETGCLAGTTREYVLDNIVCEEVGAEIGELESADAIYLTSAGLGIVRVAEYDGRELLDINHPIQTLWPPS